jgi:hypothetical protein
VCEYILQSLPINYPEFDMARNEDPRQTEVELEYSHWERLFYYLFPIQVAADHHASRSTFRGGSPLLVWKQDKREENSHGTSRKQSDQRSPRTYRGVPDQGPGHIVSCRHYSLGDLRRFSEERSTTNLLCQNRGLDDSATANTRWLPVIGVLPP